MKISQNFVAFSEYMNFTMVLYPTRALKTRSMCIFYPILEDHFFVLKEFFLMYG